MLTMLMSLFVGGLHPDQYWSQEALFSATRERFPHIATKVLTAVEIKHYRNFQTCPTCCSKST